MMSSELSVTDIHKKIPHRFPFLLVDRLLSFQHGPDPKKRVGRKVHARKNVTINEAFFAGHFPNNPILPGVLQVEIMAQTGALACVAGKEDKKIDVLIAKINQAKFKHIVTPGDVLDVYAEVISEKRSIVCVNSKIFCEGQLVSECQVVAKTFPTE